MPIRILRAEDSDDDAAVIVQALRRAGYEPTITQVHDRDGFRAALETDVDAVVTDYALPQFGCAEALRLMTARGLERFTMTVKRACLSSAWSDTLAFADLRAPPEASG